MVSVEGLLLANSWLLLPVGCWAVVRVGLSLVVSLAFFWRTHVAGRLKTAENPRKKYGQWAVVTGCTSGIGVHYVHELASQGMDIVLVSRSMNKLKKQAIETERQYGVKTKVIVCDYLDHNAHTNVKKETEGMDIGLLVNNVGLNTDTGSRTFDEMTPNDVWNMIAVNTGAATLMTADLLPPMVARGKGCVLNVGSTSGFYIVPFQSLYCSTKSYMRLWSLALDEEIRGSGVTVRCNSPQFVRAGMCKGNNFFYNLPLWTADPRVYAHSSIMTLDTPDTGGWWMFDSMIWFISAVKTTFHSDVDLPIIYNLSKAILPFCKTVETD